MDLAIFRQMHKPLMLIWVINMVLICLYSSFRLLIHTHIQFPWYDLDIVFIFIVPTIIAFLVRTPVSRQLMIRYSFDPEKYADLKFVVLLGIAISLMVSQFLYNQYVYGIAINLNHPAQVREHINQTRFYVNSDWQLVDDADPVVAIFKQYKYPGTRPRNNNPGLTLDAYVAYEIAHTNQRVWLGHHYSEFHRGVYSDPDQALRDSFNENLVSSMEMMNHNNHNSFTASSYSFGKSGYVDAIQQRYPELRNKQISVLIPTQVFGYGEKIMQMVILFMLLGIPLIQTLMLIEQRVYDGRLEG